MDTLAMWSAARLLASYPKSLLTSIQKEKKKQTKLEIVEICEED
jgi:hypothetical protein